PSESNRAPRLATVEAALFESGRPVLLAPPHPPESLCSIIVIAWNGSTETTRAIAFAMPLLVKAQQAIVLTIEDSPVAEGPPGERLASMLRINGIAAEAMTRTGKSRTNGEAILEHARSLHADLLIKGAYTQSRLRQMIFGG